MRESDHPYLPLTRISQGQNCMEFNGAFDDRTAVSSSARLPIFYLSRGTCIIEFLRYHLPVIVRPTDMVLDFCVNIVSLSFLSFSNFFSQSDHTIYI